MVEESGKGIALVILGIVAIIAIVGLVLLFTGARKAAVGEFVVPAAKEYGGAIKGIVDPYARAFSGRAYEYPSGVVEPFMGQTEGRAGAWYGSYGDITAREPGSEQYEGFVSYNRQREEIPSVAGCQYVSEITFGTARFGTPVEASQEYNAYLGMGRKCIVLDELKLADPDVYANRYGLMRDNVLAGKQAVVQAFHKSPYACCEDAGLTGIV
ncbi:hypothetical protein KY319_02720 [Candidatus Woesearchaeota archaeon]|nr:hypothetical protein [Candidatus Woesearchaeota archaeon]